MNTAIIRGVDSQALVNPSLAQSRLRLQYLDGLRGIAALYVVLFHCYLVMTWLNNADIFPRWIRLASWPLQFGHFSVDVFIVLSGYVLMLPIVRRGDKILHTAEFLKRRARRILPPYYAVIILTLLLDLAVPALGHAQGWQWQITLPALSAAQLLSHLFLVHNFIPALASGINYPLWSVATEFQIYIAFPFLLLPLWRRFGMEAVLLTALGFVLVSHFAAPSHANAVCTQMIFLFALGMAGAFWGGKPPLWFHGIRWGIASGIFGGIVLALVFLGPQWWISHVWLVDLLIGAAAGALLVACTAHLESAQQPRPVLLTFLEWPIAVRLGAFSYSLYLVHAPVLAAVQIVVRTLHLDPPAQLGCLLIIGTPLSVSVAYLFHLIFERPFMPGRPKTERHAEAAAIVSPAP